MAEEHVGPRPAAWTKIFSGFRVALDLKKLLLAGAGILATALGWLLLSWVAYAMVSKPDYAANNKPEEWNDFKARRASWNLLYLLAGSGDHPHYDAGDLATSLPEYEALQEIKRNHDRFNKETVKVRAVAPDKELRIKVGENEYPIEIVADPKGVLKGLQDDKIYPFREFTSERENLFQLGQGADAVTIKVLQNADKVRDYRAKAADLTALQVRALALDGDKRATYETALKAYREKMLANELGVVPVKQGGLIRTLPWFAYRGENPYLLVSRLVKETSATQAGHATSVPRGHFVAAFTELIPVLLEPLVKILTPAVYLFHPAADWYVKIYLLLVLLYALAVWGFFGGAITRLAAVQIARNEKIPLREALVFAKDRFVSFFAAPAFPLLLLGILVFALWVFGWVEGFIPIFGDIVVAGVLWPIVLVVGLIMAVVLVGLAGWPLMNATISVEGSDSFDALSRSYSYVYQAPWHYLWYGLVATFYGAALVFFVGFMASLIVFLGKWGVGMTPGIGSRNPEYDREPSYLFMYAPTSFGWRDLLIHDSPNVQPVVDRAPIAPEFRFNDRYAASLTWYNKFGAVLVAVWMYAFFLLVVGFGYSYFWSAATIIYFLMRRHVDDTDLDEVHLEEDEALDPFARPPAAPGTPAAKSDKVSLSMVDAPVLRPVNAPPLTPPPSPPPPPLAPSPPPPPPPPVAPQLPLESPAVPPVAPLASAEPPPAPTPSASDTYVPPPTEPPGPPPTTP
jgi:hypothetical protein